MAARETLSFCRICMGHCGMVVSVDENNRLAGIRADREDLQTLGYACFKGLQSVEAHNSPQRLLHPLKRMPDGSFQKIGLEQALDEIAAKLGRIVARDGGEAVGGYKGGGAFFTASAVLMMNSLLNALGSPKAFSSVTIDQSAKFVAAGRIGLWPPGKVPMHRGDVFLLVGSNPLVSVNPPFDMRNPMKRMKEAKARGMKLILIDPRRTETAKFADLFLQPLPGEDASLIAGILHIIFAEGWEDKEFCAAHIADVERLRRAVAPFTSDYVSARADVPKDKLLAAAQMFARDHHRGVAGSSTGPDMGPHSNLAEHLIEALNYVCGRVVRAGERIDNPGVLAARHPRKAQAVPAGRWWEQGYKSRVGDFGVLDGELGTGIMADEILLPGKGQVKALIVHGGNPASSVPNQRRVVDALRSLELLVSIEPFMTVTAQISHYVLPPKMQYEREDLPFWLYERMCYPQDAFTRYTPAVAPPPPGSEVSDDWYLFWGLAKRLGLTLDYLGQPMDMTTPPTTESLLAHVARHAPVPFAELQGAPRGALYEGQAEYALPADPDWQGRLTVAPDDVVAELAELAGEFPGAGASDFTHRLAVRRQRDVFNSVFRTLPQIKKRLPYNLAYINPEDLKGRGIAEGDRVEIISETGTIIAVAEADETVRSGVVSISHGFGGLPDDSDYAKDGASTNLLLASAADRQTINAMPQMTAIPVAIRRAEWPRNV